uniref:Neuromedin-S n=1 Tax=Salvator merianae TaxID=96440 RepID=A0A8D0EA82_SALMN
MQKPCRAGPRLSRALKMKRLPPFPYIFMISWLCTLQLTSGFPQPFDGYLSELNIPKSERLALCFSQWTELSDQPQISSSVVDLCNSMFNSMQIDEFLFHYSRGQDPTIPVKTGESQHAEAEFRKKDGLDTLGRPFFLFRPRNGRTADNGDE